MGDKQRRAAAEAAADVAGVRKNRFNEHWYKKR